MKHLFCLLIVVCCIGCQHLFQNKVYSIKPEEAAYIEKAGNLSRLDKNAIGECVKNAIDNDWYVLMNKLADAGIIDTDIPVQKNNRSYYYSALEYAVIQNKVEAVKRLIDAGADLNKGSEPPICQAICNDNFEIVRMLVDAGARVNKETSESEYAIISNSSNVEITKYLLMHGANPNEVGWEGLTALHEVESVEMAKLLVEYGAKMIPDNYGQTPLFFAAFRLDASLVKYFVELGEDVNRSDNLGQIPLFRFYDAFSADEPTWLHIEFGNAIDIHNMLLERVNNVNIVDDDGRALLHYASSAICYYDIFFVHDLIKKGAKVNIQDKEGKTPAHLAAKFGNLRILNELVKKGADLTIKDSEGHSVTDIIKENYPFVETSGEHN